MHRCCPRFLCWRNVPARRQEAVAVSCPEPIPQPGPVCGIAGRLMSPRPPMPDVTAGRCPLAPVLRWCARIRSRARPHARFRSGTPFPRATRRRRDGQAQVAVPVSAAASARPWPTRHPAIRRFRRVPDRPPAAQPSPLRRDSAVRASPASCRAASRCCRRLPGASIRSAGRHAGFAAGRRRRSCLHG